MGKNVNGVDQATLGVHKRQAFFFEPPSTITSTWCGLGSDDKYNHLMLKIVQIQYHINTNLFQITSYSLDYSSMKFCNLIGQSEVF